MAHLGDVVSLSCERCRDGFTHTVSFGKQPRFCSAYCAHSRSDPQYQRDYRERNKEDLKRKVEEKYRAHPEKLALVRYRKRCRRYGITQEHHEAMLSIQVNRCACCRATADPTRQFAIDHDHACCDRSAGSCGRCLRGLLCWHCNTNRLTDEMVLHKAAYILFWRNVGLSVGEQHLDWLRHWTTQQASLIGIEPLRLGADHAIAS